MASKESREERKKIEKIAVNTDHDFPKVRREWEADEIKKGAIYEGTTIEACTISGISCEWVKAPEVDKTHTLIHFHGGGYVAGSCITHRRLAANISAASGIQVLLVDYRRAPEHPHPAALDDAVAVYRSLVDNGMPPANIIIGGDSAGGGISMATLLYLRDNELPLPTAAYLISPWVDLTCDTESYTTRLEEEPLLVREELQIDAGLYAGGMDLKTPYISPVYGDLQGLPELLIQVGDYEILLTEALQLADKAKEAGVNVSIEVWDEMWHVWHAFTPEVPEAYEAIDKIAALAKKKFHL